MTKYLVTTELNENRWRRFLRWLRLNKKGNFTVIFADPWFNKNEIIEVGVGGAKIKILKKLKTAPIKKHFWWN